MTMQHVLGSPGQTPDQAPPGVTLRFLPRPTGAPWADWLKVNTFIDRPDGTPTLMAYWESRPVIEPRLILVHTNGASEEGTAASAYNYSMSAPGRTLTHYQVDRDGSAVKFLPSDRQGIAQYLANPFAISIETADLGWPTATKPDRPGGTIGFSAAQAETVARIIAWESALWDIPIEYPATWDGTGVASHTEPFAFPYWSNSPGKPCPGPTKKIEMRESVMPRARQIRYPQEEDDMSTAFFEVEGLPGQYMWTPGSDPIPFTNPTDRDVLLKGLGVDPANGGKISQLMYDRLFVGR